MQKNIIPHEYVVLTKTAEKAELSGELPGYEKEIFNQVDGKKTISEIADMFAIKYNEAIDHFNSLYAKGFVKLTSVMQKNESPVQAGFFTTLETELVDIIGPVATYVIDEVLWDMGRQKNNFEAGQVPELVESLSEEIADNYKRIMFQQNMLERIKGLSLV